MRKWLNLFCALSLISSMFVAVIGSPQITKAANESIKVNVDGNVVKWLMDEANQMIYAVTNANKLLFIQTGDLSVQTVDIPGIPVDLDVYNGNLYITTSGAKILVVDLATKTVQLDKTIYVDADNIAIDNNKIFILKGTQWVTLKYYDLATGSINVIKQFNPEQAYQDYYNPNLVVNPASHTLYIGESSYGACNIFALNTVDFSPISKSNYNNYGFTNAAKIVTLGDNHVYFAGCEFDSTNLEQMTGDYGIPHDPILYVQGNDVFSNHAIFDRFSCTKIKDLPSTTLNVMEDSSRNVFLASANQIEKTPFDKVGVVTDPGTTDPGTTDPGTTDPGTTDPGTTDPGTTDPGTTDPGTTDPSTTDPGTTDPGTTDPGTIDQTPVTQQPEEIWAYPKTVDFKPYTPTDIGGHWAYNHLLNFVYSGLIKGYQETNGTYTVRPDNNITRAEVVAILVRSLGLTSNTSGKTFTDVTKSSWYYEPIRIASSLNIVSGTGPNKFEPERNVTRAELATMIIRAFGSAISKNGTAKVFGDVPANYWAKSYIDDATKAGIINGYPGGLFKPGNNATRAEAITMLSVALKAQQNQLPDNETLTNCVTNQENALLELLNKGSWTGQYNQISSTTTGYDFVYATDKINSFGESNNAGYKISAERSGDFKATVTQKSNTFAVVNVTGASRLYTITDYYQTTFQAYSPDSYNVYLKKDTATGEFKIYWEQPVLTQQETSYLTQTASFSTRLRTEKENLFKLIYSPDVWTESWYESMSNEMDRIITLGNDMSSMEAPNGRLSIIDTEMGSALWTFGNALEQIGNAFADEDYYSANNTLNYANTILVEAMRYLDGVDILLSVNK